MAGSESCKLILILLIASRGISAFTIDGCGDVLRTSRMTSTLGAGVSSSNVLRTTEDGDYRYVSKQRSNQRCVRSSLNFSSTSLFFHKTSASSNPYPHPRGHDPYSSSPRLSLTKNYMMNNRHRHHHHHDGGQQNNKQRRSQTKMHLQSTSSNIHHDIIDGKKSRTNTPSLKHKLKKSTMILKATSSEDIKAAAAAKKKFKKKRRTIRRDKIPKADEASSALDGTRINARTGTRRRKSKPHKDEDGEVAALIDYPEADLPLPSSKGMDRLSRAVAKASAKRESHSASINESKAGSGSHSRLDGRRVRKLIRRETDNRDQSASQSRSQSQTQSPAPKSLSQLTRVIDSKLFANGPRGTFRGDYPEIEGVVQNARDNMISLLGFNQAKGDWKIHSSTSTFNVAIVFGKKLVRDQVTVEYASRIRTLGRLFKNEPEFRPSLVCFLGGVADGSNIANSDAGYIFFRHMCEAQGIDLGGVDVFINNDSEDDYEAVMSVTEAVKEKYIPQWLEGSPNMTPSQQKSIDVHFTLVSTEYHLCNINDVHHRSPEQSLLEGMEHMGETLHVHRHCISDSQQYQDKLSKKEFVQGVVRTSWSFQYATYPYIYAKNDSVVFLGKCFLLGEELKPLLVNMKAVVEQKEFFQRDNYLMLSSIRRSLVESIEALHKPSHSRKKTLNHELRRVKDIDGMERDVITILEGALLSLGRCVDLVKPAGMHVGSVSKDDWKKALKALEHSMNEIHSFCDPDRPLLPSEWGKIVDDAIDN